MTNEHARSVGRYAALLFLLLFAAALNSGCDSCKTSNLSPRGRSRALAPYSAKTAGDGALDASFGTGGKVTSGTPGAVDEAIAAAFEPGGQIVVAGTTT